MVHFGLFYAVGSLFIAYYTPCARNFSRLRYTEGLGGCLGLSMMPISSFFLFLGSVWQFVIYHLCAKCKCGRIKHAQSTASCLYTHGGAILEASRRLIKRYKVTARPPRIFLFVKSRTVRHPSSLMACLVIRYHRSMSQGEMYLNGEHNLGLASALACLSSMLRRCDHGR